MDGRKSTLVDVIARRAEPDAAISQVAGEIAAVALRLPRDDIKRKIFYAPG